MGYSDKRNDRDRRKRSCVDTRRPHIRLVVMRCHGEPHGRTGAQVVDLVFTQTERVGIIDGDRDRAAMQAKQRVDTRAVVTCTLVARRPSWLSGPGSNNRRWTSAEPTTPKPRGPMFASYRSDQHPRVTTVAVSGRKDNLNMLYWKMPGETEVGSAGEQPAKGYPGQAHQHDVPGWGGEYLPIVTKTHRIDRPAMPQKTQEGI